MVKLIVVVGNSQSGKDEFAYTLVNKANFVRVHTIDDLKDFMAEHFDKPRQHFDSSEVRNYVPRGSKLCINDLLVKSWELAQEVCPEFTYPYISRKIKELSSIGKNIVLSGVRNLHEVECIKEQLNDSIELVTVLVERKGYNGLTSDVNLDEVFNKLAEISEATLAISNNGSLEDYLKQCENLATFLSYDSSN